MKNRSHYAITKKWLYRQVYSSGSKTVTEYCIVYIRKNDLPEGITRCGFTVTKKVGSAVIRNKMKRRMRDIFFRLYGNIRLGYDMVIVAKPVIVNASFQKLSEDIYHGLAVNDMLDS
ncbi:MAG: ribonuclease P protein component [Candidatus Auribacterota bacterium]|jgi:ribonuclease P protein component|nr:ribonuclease P protein component [Candidatus Auribacterota bacterium]